MSPLPQRPLATPTKGGLDVALQNASRFVRAVRAQNRWAAEARQCYAFLEGDQWPRDEVERRKEQRRLQFTANKIRPLVNLVLGYFDQNKRQIEYRAGNDFVASEQVAKTLNQISKVIDQQSHAEWHNAEAFLDGITGGRGVIDQRIDYARNVFGEVVYRACDPFSVFPDPEADSYDPADWGFVSEARWLTFDQVRHLFGMAAVREATSDVAAGQGPINVADFNIAELVEQPETYFGQYSDEQPVDDDGWGVAGFGAMGELKNGMPYLLDPTRRLVRVIETQHKVWERGQQLVDMVTGQTRTIAQRWTRERIQTVLAWSALKGQETGKGQTLAIHDAIVPRWRWTVTAGDRTLYDDWSPYQRPTFTFFFPYFRRGITRGLIHDLRDPQQEINRRRTARMEILARMASGGWMVEQGSLDQENEDFLQQYGSTPGVMIKYQRGTEKPEQIQPALPPRGQQELEASAAEDLKEVSGINDSALGQLDQVQSGRAVLARQRQAVVGLEPYMDNFERTLHLLGEQRLELIQNYYTEERIFRVRGDDGRDQILMINQAMADGTLVNDVTGGHYMVFVDQQPLTATYQEAVHETHMELLSAGIPIPYDQIIKHAPIPDKHELLDRMQAQQEAQAAADETALANSAMPGAGGGMNGAGGPPQQQPKLTQSERSAGPR